MRGIAAVVVVGLVSRSAFAEPPGMMAPLPPAPPAEPAVESYHLQTAAADVLALTTALTVARHSSALGELALGTYLLGAPAVHLAHHRAGRALGSLAMRVGIPLGTALLLSSGHSSNCDVDCGLDELGEVIVGLAVGGVAASVIDSAFLAKGDDPPPAPSWGPTVAPVHSGFTFGVGGSF